MSERVPKRLAVDIGGTFTDVVLETGERTLTTKVLTTPKPERGVLDGVAQVLARADHRLADIDLLIHGTTLATNAIIERKGARTAFITTHGFRDTLEIGDEGRHDQYDLYIEKPAPLVSRALRLPVLERVSVHGEVLVALDEASLRQTVARLLELDVQSVAVGFMHAYRNPVHEQRAREVLGELAPGLAVTLSSEVCPEIREYERFSTACANAYVQPLMARYLERLESELLAAGMRCAMLLMTSGGGLTNLETARRFPIRLVESGPAGGAILACELAREHGLDQVLSFDMGGTTAKICLIEQGRTQTARSFEVDRAARFVKGSGLPLRIPVVEMVEIGAGGGSIARVDTLGKIAVGPESAGSEPGPACYNRGGNAPTVTDADLCMGYIDPRRFAGGAIALDPSLATAALTREVAPALRLTPELAAFGVIEMVDETMANAARVHAVERGLDIGAHSLVAFGGAAPLHAVQLAQKLGIDHIVIPPNAGVGSAVGFLRAPVSYEVLRSRYLRLKDFEAAVVNTLFDELRDEAMSVVSAEVSTQAPSEHRLAYMRYVGQGHEIAVALPVRRYDRGDAAVLKTAYEQRYAQQFSRVIPQADIEVLSWSVTMGTPAHAGPPANASGDAPSEQAGEQRVREVFNVSTGGLVQVHTYEREALARNTTYAGPCIITEAGTSTVVSEAFEAASDDAGFLVLSRRKTRRQTQ